MPALNADAARDLDTIRDALLGGDREFDRRLDEHFPRLHALFFRLYGDRADGFEALRDTILIAGESWDARAQPLRDRDAERELPSESHADSGTSDTLSVTSGAPKQPWFADNRLVGGVAYVDRYASDLAGMRARIPDLKDLGLGWLHLMPLFRTPEGDDDGGYAVSSYREVDPALGTIADLRQTATELHEAGLSLVLDFVFNHTASDHEWARKAVAGEPGYEDFYLIFPDRELPDRYEQTVREIFPDDHPGSFIQLPDGRWIWSTFHHYQWDLNYANPTVFRAMAGEMLFLANLGVDVLRMDAVAFIWKQLGTPSESLPEAHLLLQAFNAVLAIAAPGVVFLSEAIVHPDEVVDYISTDEARLSYNPLQMALTWEALATRDPRLLRQALERRHTLPDGTAWVNYVRGHDDIGWTFADEDAAELGIDAGAHRRFLNEFYSGRFEGSFARGVLFQENPRTGDARVAGTTASLAGVEARDPAGVQRVVLAHSIAFSTGGVPLIYLGDEVGQLNDYSYADDPERARDSRWVNRPEYPAEAYASRDDERTVAGWLHRWMRRLIEVRQATPELAGTTLLPFDARSPHVLAFQRTADSASALGDGAGDGSDATGSTVLVLANFGDEDAEISAEVLSGFAPIATELITSRVVSLGGGIVLEPRHLAWLRVQPAAAAGPERF
ncbi:alpha-amylase family protein [Schumannella luteola]|uniref:Amylosucrase n=1 Tax=Schumannella luteola TaxID=472059 RepID=A0A852Y616_9MICO|nr:alpha-amylase family protein [Schumannella luteola]NYG97713.1 amylosucrase [Schumannella luteola]TPX01420.1 amylosucrase [Schumannella luteola]